MEQLSGETIERLLARARAGVLVPERPGGLGAPGELWAQPVQPQRLPRPAPAFTTASALLPVGVERRLVRRAEALWASLFPDGAALPAADSAALLLAPPYSGQAMLISLPPHPTDPGSRQPRIAFVGAALLELGLLVPGTADGDARPEAPLGPRLVALAEQAAATGVPTHFDSEADLLPPRLRPQLLMRAVALPFRADPASGAAPVVAVVTS